VGTRVPRAGQPELQNEILRAFLVDERLYVNTLEKLVVV